jgi:hypothetical protein
MIIRVGIQNFGVFDALIEEISLGLFHAITLG